MSYCDCGVEVIEDDIECEDCVEEFTNAPNECYICLCTIEVGDEICSDCAEEMAVYFNGVDAKAVK